VSSGGRPALVGTDDLTPLLEALRNGLVVGVPTDTVYGLAARLEPEAVDRVFAAKGRPPALALPVLVGSLDQLSLVASSFPAAAQALAEALWPGPLTLVIRARRRVGALVGGSGRTVGVRWPAFPLVEQLCLEAGPLAVTSANRHGEPPLTTADAVRVAFSSEQVAVVADGGRCEGTPSTVVDCTGRAPTCLREGAVPWEAIERSLR